MKRSNDQPVDAIDVALRGDATRWDPGPSPDFAETFREPATDRRRVPLAMWLAAALVAGLGSWWGLTMDDRDVEIDGIGIDMRAHVERVIHPATEVVFAPLETELRAVAEDAGTLANVVWQGVRHPVARWLSESE